MFACAVALLAVSLSACKTQLQADLGETEANEMLAILLNHDLDAAKQAGKENRYELIVEQEQLAKAIDLLKSFGYPKRQFDSVGKVFAQQGVISSPKEERIRYIYALSQEMAQALNSLDGVVEAYVQVVLPDNNPFQEKLSPSSASVLIRHHRDAAVDILVPQIKQFVANAVEGLKYDRVSISMIPATNPFVREASQPTMSLLGISVSAESKTAFLLLLGGLCVCVCALGGVVAYILFRRENTD